MDTDMGTLASALYVSCDDLLKEAARPGSGTPQNRW